MTPRQKAFLTPYDQALVAYVDKIKDDIQLTHEEGSIMRSEVETVNYDLDYANCADTPAYYRRGGALIVSAPAARDRVRRRIEALKETE
jgi:hypothetical protein